MTTIQNQKQQHDSEKTKQSKNQNKITTLHNGYLGSRDDEERSEMRYVVRSAKVSESSNL